MAWQGATARLWRGMEWLREARWLLLVAAVVAVAGTHGAVSCGHDFDFHLASWMDVAHAWRQGIALPGWAESAAWQAGEPRFVFYPPLTWLVGALLGTVLHTVLHAVPGTSAVGWTLAAGVFVWMALVASGVATRTLAAQWLPRATAQLAGVLAIVAPYALFTAFERSALAELAAAVWIPLALALATRPVAGIWNRTTADRLTADRSTAGLALVIAGCWLTNAPAAVMLCYALALVVLVSAWSARSVWPVLRALVAVILGLGLAAFYLVPAAQEQRWVNIRSALDAGMRVEDSWLFARHAGAAMDVHDAVLREASWVVAITVALTLLALVLVARAGGLRREKRTYWLPLLLLVPAVLGMQFAWSAAVWHRLPKMDFLQFPWRLTMLLTPVLAVFVAQALQGVRKRLRMGVLAAWVLVAALACGYLFHQPCDDEDNVAAQWAQRQGDGFAATDEYTPLGADNAMLAAGLPAGCVVADAQTALGSEGEDGLLRWNPKACLAVAQAVAWRPDQKLLTVAAPHAGFLILRLRRFPAWQIAVNGQPAAVAAEREDGLMVVRVPAGASTIRVRWTTTLETRLGRWISLAAVVLWMALWFASRCRRPRLHDLH